MHKFDKSTVKFDSMRDGYILSRGVAFQPNFSMTDAPPNWWRTSRFGSSLRFREFDQDRLAFPNIGQYNPHPASTVECKSVSLTVQSNFARRCRATAPATGAAAEARKWGADKFLEDPGPGPGAYGMPPSTLRGGVKGQSSSFMRSTQPRFPQDAKHGFLRVKHQLSPEAARRRTIPRFELAASLARGTPCRARRRPRTTGSASRRQQHRQPQPQQQQHRRHGATMARTLELRNADVAATAASVASAWSPIRSGRTTRRTRGDGGTSNAVGTTLQSMLGKHKKPTPAQRRDAFDRAEELKRVEELDVFSYRLMGKHHKVQKMLAKKEEEQRRQQRAQTAPARTRHA